MAYIHLPSSRKEKNNIKGEPIKSVKKENKITLTMTKNIGNELVSRKKDNCLERTMMMFIQDIKLKNATLKNNFG